MQEFPDVLWFAFPLIDYHEASAFLAIFDIDIILISIYLPMDDIFHFDRTYAGFHINTFINWGRYKMPLLCIIPPSFYTIKFDITRRRWYFCNTSSSAWIEITASQCMTFSPYLLLPPYHIIQDVIFAASYRMFTFCTQYHAILTFSLEFCMLLNFKMDIGFIRAKHRCKRFGKLLSLLTKLSASRFIYLLGLSRYFLWLGQWFHEYLLWFFIICFIFMRFLATIIASHFDFILILWLNVWYAGYSCSEDFCEGPMMSGFISHLASQMMLIDGYSRSGRRWWLPFFLYVFTIVGLFYLTQRVLGAFTIDVCIIALLAFVAKRYGQTWCLLKKSTSNAWPYKMLTAPFQKIQWYNTRLRFDIIYHVYTMFWAL